MFDNACKKPNQKYSTDQEKESVRFELKNKSNISLRLPYSDAAFWLLEDLIQ